MRDSAGIQIIESVGPAWTPENGWRLSAEPVVDIGAVDGPPEYRFDRIRDIIRISDGRILVADGGSAQIRFYASDGAYLQASGGEGEGPGEFRDLSGVASVGDSLFVYDRDLSRLSVFDRQGEYLGSIRPAQTTDPLHPIDDYRLAGAIDERGLLFTPYAFPATEKPTPTVYWDSAANLLYSLDGVLLDTLGGFSGMDIYGAPDLGTQLIFGATTQSDVHGGQFYIGHAHAYEIDVYAARGQLSLRIRKQEVPTPVTEDLLDDNVARVLAGVEDATMRAALRRHYREVPHAEHLPAYSDIVVGTNGTVWTERYRPRWQEGPRTWEVFAPEGRWLGTVEVPDRFTIQEVGQDYIIGIGRDEFDVEHVQMYHLARTGG